LLGQEHGSKPRSRYQLVALGIEIGHIGHIISMISASMCVCVYLKKCSDN